MTAPDPTPEQLDAARQAMRQAQPTPEEIRAAWDAIIRAIEPLNQVIANTKAAFDQLAETFRKAQTQADYALIPAGIDDADDAPTTLYVVVQHRFSNGGDLTGSLMTHTGRTIYTHTSSSPAWLVADLTQNFGRDVELAEQFGDFTTVYVALGDQIPDEIAGHINGTESEPNA